MLSSGILCNGPPKAATHLLLRIIQLFGAIRRNGLVKEQGCLYKAQHKWRPRLWVENHIRGYCMPSHVPYDSRYKNPLTITILRDPRNILISRYRKLTPKYSLIEIIQRSQNRRACLDCYDGYLEDKNFPVFFFEQIIANPATELIRIKQLIQSNRDVDYVHENMIGPEFTGHWSDWKEYLTPEINEAFIRHGIHKLAKRWGYEE